MWSNTYVIGTESALNSPAMLTDVGELVAFEKKAHLPAVFYMRAVISTLQHEGAYDPNAVRTIELTGNGTRGGIPNDPQALALDVALGVKLQGVTGRAALMLYRGALMETDVEKGDRGKFNLVTDITQFPLAVTEFFAAGHAWNLLIANKRTGQENTVRPVSAISLGGVVIKKHDIHSQKKVPKTGGGIVAGIEKVLPVVAGIAAAVLTKNPAAFSIAERLSITASASQLGTLAEQVLEHLPQLPGG